MLLGRELTAWQTPWSQLNAMQREMNALLGRFFGEGESRGNTWQAYTAGYVPQIESQVKDNHLYIKADLPGIDPKDIDIIVEGNRLTLRGERKYEQDGQEGQYFHREVRYGSFVRTFTVPEGIKAEDIQASYRNGVLELTVPLPASVLPKKVSIAVESHANGHKQIEASK